MENTLFLKKALFAFSLFAVIIILTGVLSGCSPKSEDKENSLISKIESSTSEQLLHNIYNSLKDNNFKKYKQQFGTKHAYIKLIKARTDLNESDKQDKIIYAEYKFDGLDFNIKKSFNEIINNNDYVLWDNIQLSKIEYTKNNENSASAFIIISDGVNEYKILVTNCINTSNGWYVFTDIRWVG